MNWRDWSGDADFGYVNDALTTLLFYHFKELWSFHTPQVKPNTSKQTNSLRAVNFEICITQRTSNDASSLSQVIFLFFDIDH